MRFGSSTTAARTDRRSGDDGVTQTVGERDVRRMVARIGARRRALLVGLGVFVVLIVATGFLAFGLYGDEVSFLRTSLNLTDPAVSWSTRLAEYDEFSTPLAFVVFGVVSRLTNDGPEAARLVSWLCGIAIVTMVAFARRTPGRETPRAVVGIVTHPYLLLTAVLMYSDVPAAALCVAGMLAHRRRRHLASGVFFTLAIATRQFSIVFPLALVATAWWPVVQATVRNRTWSLRPPPVGEWIWNLVAACSYGIWVVMMGGVTNEAALEVRAAPEAQSSTFGIEPSSAFHALAVLTAYFVAVEIVLRPDRSLLVDLRSWRTRHTVLVVVTVVMAFVFPVSLDGSGAVLNVIEGIPTPPVRTVVFAVLASAAVVRFARGGVETWIVAGHVALMTKSYQWDKYVLAVVVVFWLLSVVDDPPTRRRASDPELIGAA